MEDEFVIREKKILTILKQEIQDGEEMATAVRHIAEKMLLGEKGYSPEELQKGVSFTVELGAEKVRSFVDFLIVVNRKPALVIKCAAGSLSSRERHVIAAARVIRDRPVPVAAVMDPMSAVVLDTMSGNILGEGFESIPARAQLAEMLAGRELQPLSPQKLEREKRVLLAFDAIQCCVPRGADGGVAIGEPETDE